MINSLHTLASHNYESLKWYIYDGSQQWKDLALLCTEATQLCISDLLMWVGVVGFLRWWRPSTLWAGPLICYGHHQGCLNNLIFSNLGLCAACWPYFVCHHQLWPKSVSYTFSFFHSSLGLAGGKHYQKIIIRVFRIVLENFAISGYFPHILFCRYILYLLSSGWFVIAVCGSVSVRELVK